MISLLKNALHIKEKKKKKTKTIKQRKSTMKINVKKISNFCSYRQDKSNNFNYFFTLKEKFFSFIFQFSLLWEITKKIPISVSNIDLHNGSLKVFLTHNHKNYYKLKVFNNDKEKNKHRNAIKKN